MFSTALNKIAFGLVVILTYSTTSAEVTLLKVERDETDGHVKSKAEAAENILVVRSDYDRMSDRSFEVFAEYPLLRGVYLWNTSATGTGFENL